MSVFVALNRIDLLHYSVEFFFWVSLLTDELPGRHLRLKIKEVKGERASVVGLNLLFIILEGWRFSIFRD